MPQVRCDLPNASELINGVAFTKTADGCHVSEEISQEQAERFCRIPGYFMHDAAAPNPPGVPANPPPVDSDAPVAGDSAPGAEVVGSGEGAPAVREPAQEGESNQAAGAENSDGAAVVSEGGSPSPSDPAEENYGEMLLTEVKAKLKADPSIHAKVLASENARPEGPRKGVVEACAAVADFLANQAAGA
ncbi:MAG: hypothetical protein COX57_05730 [Alphaproteobacteria bacterium CG_4_10_14_0_2_um_filter_63_37]|nr:MAG: hypothetical protein COX57_05730 [Alphaproteobacteria bacterium CG_4_10_14_0_2_um_filter_63_37]